MQQFFTEKDDFKSIISKYVKFEKLNYIAVGWTNFVYTATSKDGTYFFRFPRNKFFSDAIIEEEKIIKFLKNKISYKLPQITLLFDNSRPFSMHKQIEGESLTNCFHKLSTCDLKILAEDIANLFYEFSLIKIENKNEFRLTSNFLDNLSLVSQNNYDITTHDILKNLEKKSLSFCHGDLNTGNLIIKDKRLFGVIDFAFSGVSNKMVDLARLVGEKDGEFSQFLIESTEKVFNEKIDLDKLKKLVDMWNYVDNHYIMYIKQNHPSIILE